MLGVRSVAALLVNYEHEFPRRFLFENGFAVVEFGLESRKESVTSYSSQGKLENRGIQNDSIQRSSLCRNGALVCRAGSEEPQDMRRW